MKSNTAIRAQATSEISLNGGGAVRASAGFIYLNSGGGAPPSPASAGPGPSLIGFSTPNKVPGAPNPQQIISGTNPDATTSVASRVPQHQPWSLTSGPTQGFNGFVFTDEEDDNPLAPAGAANEDATRPVDQAGYFNGSSEAKLARGIPYETSSFAEAPQYEELDIDPGELKDVDELNASDRLVKYLHTKEGLVIRLAYLDAGVAWAIGYGHNIKVGDTINGVLDSGLTGRGKVREYRVDSDFIAVLNRTNGLALSITKEEADRIFRVDLEKFEAIVRRNVQVNLTQGQFDALVSITYNIGEGNLRKSTFLSKINARQFQDVPQSWLLWRKSRNPAGQLVINEGLQKRRQEEIELFWAATIPDDDTATA